MNQKASVVVLLMLAVHAACSQTAPKLLPFQGRLTDQTGAAMSNGVRLVQFKIFEVPSGGSTVWAGELHRTTVNGGLINVLLGSKTPFTGVDFDRQLYLEITVDINGDNAITAADPPMLPRQVILPVVFAKEASDSRKLNGFTWSPIFGANDPTLAIPASKLADASLPATKIVAGSITAAQIGIGSISPDRILPRSITTNELANAVLDLLVPPGSIMAFGGTNVPTGWLLCGGSAISRSQYSRLLAAIGTAWGAGDGSTTFNLPDLRGEFLRGWDQGRGVDGSRSFGSAQFDGIRDHVHRPTTTAGYNEASTSEGGLSRAGTGFYDATANSGPMWATGSYPAAAPETRPRNVSVMYIIKY